MGEVRHDDFFGATIVEAKQVIDDEVLKRGMSDPAIEAIFANSEPGDYIEQLIMLCRSRALEIQDLQAEAIGSDLKIEDQKAVLLDQIEVTRRVLQNSLTRKMNDLRRYVAFHM